MYTKRLVLLVALLVVSLLLAACPQSAVPAAQTTSGEETAGEASAAAGPIEIEVWAQANNVEHWRADGPVEAAANVTDYEIVATGLNDDSGWADYKRKFTLAADAGEAPEIVLSGHEDVPVWANAGYIADFEECRNMYPEYDDVIESLWDSVTWNGKIWGVPQDTEARPMFFHKQKLAELGWSEEEIASLPDRILNGEFTLDDMIETARQAIEAGVVEEGHGYWHRPSKGFDFLQFYVSYGGDIYDEEQDKLVVNQEALENYYAFQRRVVDEGITPENFIGTDWSIWHDTVSHGNVLFWNGGIWQFADWATNYVAEEGGQDFLFEFVGYAVQPSGIEGQPGNTLSHPLVYMITTPDAAGTTDHYGPACAVLAQTTTPDINTRHAVESTHLGILKSQADYEPYAQDRLLSETLYMLDHNWYLPNHVLFSVYDQVVWDFMVQVENGELGAAEAAAQAVELLQAELGDQLIVE